MSCKCITCNGQPAQTLLWCIDEKRHAHEGHSGRNPGHKVVPLMAWPPKRRLYPERRLTAPINLPTEVILHTFWTGVHYPQPDQSSIDGLCGQGCCTAETAAFDVALMKIKQGLYTQPFSVSCIYAFERMDIGTFPSDSGANMVDEGNALAKHGICFESTMPFNACKCDQTPSAAAIAEAANFKCDPNQNPVDINDLLIALYNSQQNPLLGSLRMGFPVGQTFFDAATNGGWVPTTPDNDGLAGGHSEEAADLVMLQGPGDAAPRLYAVFLQSWGQTGDMSSGISLYKFKYPEFFQSNFVKNNYGLDCYQQPDLPTVPVPPAPPGYHNVTISVKQGAGMITLAQSSQPTSATSTTITVTVPDGEVVTISSVPDSNYQFQQYDGIGTGQAQTFQATITQDSSVGVLFLQKSVCPIGSAWAKVNNFLPWVTHRQGRFYYLVKR